MSVLAADTAPGCAADGRRRRYGGARRIVTISFMRLQRSSVRVWTNELHHVRVDLAPALGTLRRVGGKTLQCIPTPAAYGDAGGDELLAQLFAGAPAVQPAQHHEEDEEDDPEPDHLPHEPWEFAHDRNAVHERAERERH